MAAGEFVILDVPERIKIEGPDQAPGPGVRARNLFYQWTKRERAIQAGKQVVAQRKDRPDGFYTGDRAARSRACPRMARATPRTRSARSRARTRSISGPTR